MFYFITVDNSALNSRHSNVEYLDFTTKNIQIIDLFMPNVAPYLVMFLALLIPSL